MIIPVLFLESLQDCSQNATNRCNAGNNDGFTHQASL
jgi:hypothetical protein